MNDPVRNRHDRKMAQTRLPRCGTSLLKTDANGPLPPLADVSDAAPQLSHCSHSCKAQHFQ